MTVAEALEEIVNARREIDHAVKRNNYGDYVSHALPATQEGAVRGDPSATVLDGFRKHKYPIKHTLNFTSERLTRAKAKLKKARAVARKVRAVASLLGVET